MMYLRFSSLVFDWKYIEVLHIGAMPRTLYIGLCAKWMAWVISGMCKASFCLISPLHRALSFLLLPCLLSFILQSLPQTFHITSWHLIH